MRLPVYTSLRVFLYEAISRVALFENTPCLAMTNGVFDNNLTYIMSDKHTIFIR